MTKISICIPAYKRPENINRLLESIRIQTFRDFEIIITDDSPDNSLQGVLQKYAQLPIVYKKNPSPLGTPANWNYGISLASGEWIKIMHDDDWFVDEDSLQYFANATLKSQRFIFSRYYNVFDSGTKKQPFFPHYWKNKIINQPLILLANNVIGPPSVTLIHSSIKKQYDISMKWRVDIDYYIRILLIEKSYDLIDRPLINVGIGKSQVTNFCINEPEVELPEGILLLEKYGINPLQNILVYDTWWRILRNVNVRSVDQLKKYSGNKEWPEIIKKMVKLQSKVPTTILEIGLFSKLLMLISYFDNYSLLRK